jgi:hypothetical protein
VNRDREPKRKRFSCDSHALTLLVHVARTPPPKAMRSNYNLCKTIRLATRFLLLV